MEGATRVKDIVQDLKGFARVESESKPANINDGLESAINIVWNEMKYKAALEKDLGDLPMTKCNIGQLNQVFMNILMNAAQAIDKWGEIRVKTWAAGNEIFISIADTGCGISPQILNRIYEPFFTTKEVGKGTGLGLSVSYDIVKKHGGYITVDSEPGKGTTFTICIPILHG
jgi:two-component system NtrC family sensor kinase